MVRALTLALAVVSPLLVCAGQGDRTWTATDGRTFVGSLVEAKGDVATVRRSDGRRFELPLASLSADDRAWVARYLADAKRASGLEDGPFADRVTGDWVKVPKDEFGLVFQLYGTKKLKRVEGTFPLVLHLHGAAGRADDVDAGNVEIAAERLAREDQYDETPCLLVVPTCPPDTSWGDHVAALEKIVDTLVDSLPIDRGRIYLSGYSMGAGGIGSLISSRPKFYAAAMFADGRTRSEWVTESDTALWLCYSGEGDPAEGEAFAKAYADAGKTVRFQSFPDVVHNSIHWKLAHDEEVFPWLFAQEREE